VPTIARAADGTLAIYFVSEARDPTNPTSEIYVSGRRPGVANWDPATALTALNSAAEHDHLPFAARIGNEIRLGWVRYDTTEPLPWDNPESDLFSATSADGLVWSAPTRVTDEPGTVFNLFPMLYSDADGVWSYLWLSGRSGALRVVERDVADVAPYPQGVREREELPPGYSHKVVATPTPGVYLAVWVQGPEGAQDVYYRFFGRQAVRGSRLAVTRAANRQPLTANR
jgi:hypothetical protein